MTFFEGRKWKKQLLPFVRFANIDLDRLQKYEDTPCLKKYCSDAYKVHAQRSNILGKACKRQRMSKSFDEVTCSCSKNNRHPCPHVNPRIYLEPPFTQGVSQMGDTDSVEPVDLSDISRFSQRMVFSQDVDHKLDWRIQVVGKYVGDTICETYTVTPALRHVGRRFTLAITAGNFEPADSTHWQHKYCIKFTGVVTAECNKVDLVELDSPLRWSSSWAMKDGDYYYGLAVILHKD